MNRRNVEFEAVGDRVMSKTFVLKMSGKAPNNSIAYSVSEAEIMLDELRSAIEAARTETVNSEEDGTVSPDDMHEMEAARAVVRLRSDPSDNWPHESVPDRLRRYADERIVLRQEIARLKQTVEKTP
jgi:hypothetical protein